MQNGALENGLSENHNDDQPDGPSCSAPIINQTEVASPVSFTSPVPHDIKDPEHEDNNSEGPPTKRRKLTDPGTPQPSAFRPVSPPWKRIAVEGPTSFVEGGRRKSSRTNFVPLELQPQAEKRQTRAASQKSHLGTSRLGSTSKFKSSPLTTSTSQPLINGKRPQSSSGNIAVNTSSKSPVKTSQQNSTSTKQPSSNLAPPVAKRSHKKKVPQRPSPESPTQSPQTANPHQTRRSVRSLAGDTHREKHQDMTTNGWRRSDEEDNEEEEDEDEEEEEEGEEEEEEEEKSVTMEPNYKPQRLNLKVRMPTVIVQHPGHVLPLRRFPSFRDWLEHEGSLPEDDNRQMTDQEAGEEARLRHRILEAAQPGGLLSEGKCSVYVPDPQDEPLQQYAHQDHLITQLAYFHKLMVIEHNNHKRSARRIAYAVAAEWKRRQPKTLEDIRAEQDAVYLTQRQQVVGKDLVRKWETITAEVVGRRRQRWEEEQQFLGKQALNKVLEKSTQLLDKRRLRGSSDVGSDGEEDSDDEAAHIDRSQSSGSNGESENEDNMSSSQVESEENQIEGQAVNATDDDEGLTLEDLRQKYAAIPSDSLNHSPEPYNETPGDIDVDPGGNRSGIGTAALNLNINNQDDAESETPQHSMNSVRIDEVADVLMDGSGASTDMDDDSESSTERQSDNDGEDSDAAEANTGLLGFFAKSEVFANTSSTKDRENVVANEADEPSEGEIEEVSLVPDATQVQTPSASNGEEPCTKGPKTSTVLSNYGISSPAHLPEDAHSGGCSPQRESKTKQSLTSLVTSNSLIQSHRDSLPTTPVSTNPLKTSVPSLLRGTLREYQHFGLDWLASLYANGTNGILADEMGLGKTIQTIALLAHLAVEHEIWGPHLIVVPTSVMLNWEMEFKKFLPGFKVLTYYGTIEERKRKRQGWMNDDKWNVWITSYQLVLADNQIFKRRAWHYMVLDEAHNIKNFRSQRWQTLLTFRTRARLLLTGTPLQNNLTELWSLLFFLMPSDGTATGIGGFADLQEFTNWFRKPVEQILEHGRETMDADAKAIVVKLHKVLRPYLLRRLKADVEKQMPGKYEHVIYCKLSKRQRHLYDGFMSRAQTRETLVSGNSLKIMNCLMQLRKVCNHPDLFETRQIVTSFAMDRSAVADFEIKELLVRRRLLHEESINTVDLNVVNLLPGANEHLSALDTIQKQRLGALGILRQLTSQQWLRVDQAAQFDGTSVKGTLANMENVARRSRFEELRHAAYLTSLRSQRRPLYSYSLMAKLKVNLASLPCSVIPERRSELSDWLSSQSPVLAEIVLTLAQRSKALESTVQKFACLTPAVVANDMVSLTLSSRGVDAVRSAQPLYPADAFHEARMRLSIAFPDKRLLQYDCGKLQRLDTLLRTLQSGGHRSLIFTQMTKVLDILEQFLNIHGHRYLRLDGQTKIEQRQIMTDRFNSDDRIDVFILSSRSGGLGINLTGADTVIFYDSDWNPAMDKQCQDRCHRIGQTRDVHIYRLVSEYTIEANILRKANQKRMLDDVVIQEGAFTTDYFNKLGVSDMLDDAAFDADAEANAAMDRVFDGRGGGSVVGEAFAEAEDEEDLAAAKVAEKEFVHGDAADFDDRAALSSGGGATPKTPAPTTPREVMPPLSEPSDVVGQMVVASAEVAEHQLDTPAAMNEEQEQEGPLDEAEDAGHIDDYMIRFLEWELKDVPVPPPVDKSKKRNRKGGEHRVRRPR